MPIKTIWVLCSKDVTVKFYTIRDQSVSINILAHTISYKYCAHPVPGTPNRLKPITTE